MTRAVVSNDGTMDDGTPAKANKANRDALVLQYLPLARAMARRSSLPFDDATQEATIGLIRAADHFDETRNTAFSTYARYWITESLQLAAIRDLPIHVPVHVAKASFAKFKRSLAGGNPQTTGDQPANDSDNVNPGQPKQRTGDRRIDHAFAMVNVHAVRTELEYEDGEPRHGDMVTQNPWPEKETSMDAAMVRAHFLHLSIRQKHALMLYYGIGGTAVCKTDSCTLEETGSIMGISREAVRQLIVRGIGALQGFAQAG